MGGVEIGGSELRMRFGVEADGAHEAERLGNPVGDALITFRLRAVLDETQHPAMGVLEVGVAAGGEGPQQVQRRRRLTVGLYLAARVGLARLGRKLDVVDDVATIARQRHAVDRFDAGGAGLGELARNAADLDDRRGGRKGHDHRHLQEDAEEVTDVVGGMLAEAFGAVSTLQHEGFARRGAPERPLQLARFAREHQRRIAAELALDLRQRREVLVDRRLLDRLHPPAIRAPTLVRHSFAPRHVPKRGLLKRKLGHDKPNRGRDVPNFVIPPALTSARRASTPRAIAPDVSPWA